MNTKENLQLDETKFSSTEFKTNFLLEFTRHLILNSAGSLEVQKLDRVLDEDYEKFNLEDSEGNVLRDRVREVLSSEDSVQDSFPKELEIHHLLEKPKPAVSLVRRKSFQINNHKPQQRFSPPEPLLPGNLRHLRPIPSKEELDLDKLNPLIKDPFVKVIECLGPDENLVVRGTMGEKKTPIILTNEEVIDVIETFSNASKIPVHEGVFRVAWGKLIFMAIKSDVVGSKFTIRKMVSH